MIDLLIEIGATIVDFFTDNGGEIIDGLSTIGIEEVIATTLLVAGAIKVTELTEESIRNEIRRRKELTTKGAKGAVVLDFIKKNGKTTITLAALDAKNRQIGSFKMESNYCSDIKKGSKILA